MPGPCSGESSQGLRVGLPGSPCSCAYAQVGAGAGQAEMTVSCPALHSQFPPQRPAGRVLDARLWTGRWTIKKQTSSHGSRYDEKRRKTITFADEGTGKKAGPQLPSLPKASCQAWKMRPKVNSSKMRDNKTYGEGDGELRCQYD